MRSTLSSTTTTTALIVSAAAVSAEVSTDDLTSQLSAGGKLDVQVPSLPFASSVDNEECIPFGRSYHRSSNTLNADDVPKPDLGLLEHSSCPATNQVCVPDHSSSLGGLCVDYNTTSMQRRLSHDTCPSKCSTEFCTCTETASKVNDCADEINNICTYLRNPDSISQCWGDQNLPFFEGVYCKLAACYLNDERTDADCQCQFYQGYCNLYSQFASRFDKVANKCARAACCTELQDRKEKALCLPGGMAEVLEQEKDSTPVATPTGSNNIVTSPTSLQTTDFFLLSGQSNMNGHTTSGQSITGDESYWLRVKSILGTGLELSVMESLLYIAIHAAQRRRDSGSPESLARHMASETMTLYDRGLLYNLDTPLRLGSCSFTYPRENGRSGNRSKGTKPTVWNANCGSSFGHELMFSRTLEFETDQQTGFEAVKTVHDGTQIHKHWYPGYGMYWEQLRSSIASRKGFGNWKGFVWHQGTQETWTEEEDTSLTYLGNLTGLINEVRSEMYQASDNDYWQCKEAIPVVVVEIGYWPRFPRAGRVREAQARYCDEDPRAELVKVNDLSRFFHFDAPSFLIGGNRIAEAYQLALRNGTFACPGEALARSPASPASAGLTWVDASPEPSTTPTPDILDCRDCSTFVNSQGCDGCGASCSWSTWSNKCEAV